MGLFDGLEFLRQGLMDNGSVGAVWPSSKGLARAMVAPVFKDRTGPLRILEVGAGMGPFTAELVAQLQPGDHLDVVELNPEFCKRLRTRFEGNPLVAVHEISILDFNPAQPYDHVVSGLPLANFPAELVEQIYAKLMDLLTPGGHFVMFEHIFGRELLTVVGTRDGRQRIRRVVEIEKSLKPYEVGTHDVIFNVPPARVRVRRRPHHHADS